MNKFLFTLLLAAGVCCGGTARADDSTDIILTKNGSITIKALFHASTQINYGPSTLLLDPLSAANYNRKASIVMITHGHPDHLDLKALAQETLPGALIVAPQSCLAKLSTLKNVRIKVLGAYDHVTIASVKKPFTAIEIGAIPAYNIVRKTYHPRGMGNGYVLTLGGKRIYFAGDTEVTPEMKQLRNIDTAFLPMNLPYTMTPQEAALGVLTFKPRVAIPYHYRYPYSKVNDNPQQFAKALKGSKITVKILDYYPASAVARAGK